MIGARRMMMAGAPSGEFNPETSISWHSLFWAEGSAMTALGYADTDPVGTWPNETGESNATEATNKPTFVAADANYNNQPTVKFSGSTVHILKSAAFSTNPTYPLSIVIVGAIRNSTYSTLIDGIGASNRNSVLRFSSAFWYIYAGSNVTGVAPTYVPHLLVAKFDTTDTLHVDNTATLSGNAGAQTLTGVVLGNYQGGGYPCEALAFVGLYQGDITADGSWADFKTWVTDHYGITLA